MIKLHEIFTSIQGEGLHSGEPCIFVRLFGCSIGCSYCDQPQEEYATLTTQQVIDLVREQSSKTGIGLICITGGEPLEQEDCLILAKQLKAKGYSIHIETSGCIPLSEEKTNIEFVMDIKTPSSKLHKDYEKIIKNNIFKLGMNDTIKVVISNKEDFYYSIALLDQFKNLLPHVIFSPVFDEDGVPLISTELVEWVLSICSLRNEDINNYIFRSKIQLQIHKILNVK